MDLHLTHAELAALCELPHMQQLAYIRGIKPYMDYKTGMVGIKRKISHQSIAEQLYVAPHQGIKSLTVTKIQVRRAVDALARAGLITIASEGRQLILKCLLAKTDFSAQNKVITSRSYQADRARSQETLSNAGLSTLDTQKAITPEPAKVIIPPEREDSYISFVQKSFDAFWSLYPEKKSKVQAQQAFEAINPDDALVKHILSGLQAHITHRNTLIAHNQWVPPWKYPANWLMQRCWEDTLTMEPQETTHAIRSQYPEKRTAETLDWLPDGLDDSGSSNIIRFQHR